MDGPGAMTMSMDNPNPTAAALDRSGKLVDRREPYCSRASLVSSLASSPLDASSPFISFVTVARKPFARLNFRASMPSTSVTTSRVMEVGSTSARRYRRSVLSHANAPYGNGNYNSPANNQPSQYPPSQRPQPSQSQPQGQPQARPQQQRSTGPPPAGARGPPNSNPKAAPLARAPYSGPPAQVPQSIMIDQSQVLGKQVISCDTGRKLGVAISMWVDPNSAEVVSLDLSTKGTANTNAPTVNIPLSAMNQIGDVILVNDEMAMYQQPLDGRYGYLVLTGVEVKTQSGEFLGKLRDFSFSPDSGTISSIVYDDFGLSFLPVNFFDTFSLPLSNVLSFSPFGIVVTQESK
eukprot:gene7729-900_t